MKTLKIIVSSLFLFAFSLGFVSCSSDSGSSDSSNLTGSEVSITDVNEAKLAILAASSIIELGSTDISEYTDINDIPHSSPALAMSLASVNQNVNCQRWGEDTADGTFNAVGDMSSTSVNMTYTYHECWVNDYERINGKKTLSGSINDNGLATVNIKTTDYYMVGQYKMNTSAVAKFYVDGDSSFDILLNGKIESYYTYNSLSYTSKMGYENFHYVEDANGYETINGKVSISGSPNTCSDGIYTIETLEKIVSTAEGTPYDGKIKVNGTTYQFNSDGSVSLTFANGSTNQFMFANVEDANCSK